MGAQYEFPSFVVGANKSQIFLYGDLSNSDCTNSVNQHDWKLIDKLCLDVSNGHGGKSFDVTSIAWSPHIARKEHLIAAGCSDGFVRIMAIGKDGLSKKIEWNL